MNALSFYAFNVLTNDRNLAVVNQSFTPTTRVNEQIRSDQVFIAA